MIFFRQLPANTNIWLLQTPFQARDCAQLEIYMPSLRGLAWPWDLWQGCCLPEFKTNVEKRRGGGQEGAVKCFKEEMQRHNQTHMARALPMCWSKEMEQGGVGDGSGGRGGGMTLSWAGWVSSWHFSWARQRSFFMQQKRCEGNVNTPTQEASWGWAWATKVPLSWKYDEDCKALKQGSTHQQPKPPQEDLLCY